MTVEEAALLPVTVNPMTTGPVELVVGVKVYPTKTEPLSTPLPLVSETEVKLIGLSGSLA